jgi:hypothetical protein
MLRHSPMRFFFGLALVCLALPALSHSGERQMNLPHPGDQVVLPEAARQALVNTLAGGSYILDRGSSASFMGGLPKSFSDSCGEVLQNWGEEARRSAYWTVRVLLNLRTPQANQALLALRCGSNAPGIEGFYDERPALVTFAAGATTLRFIPLAEECRHCAEPFFHVEYSQMLRVKDAVLLELQVSDTHNPCCDGGDEQTKERLVFLAVPDGQQVLALDQEIQEVSYDDSDDGGDTNYVCRSKIDYSRDLMGNVESIRSKTQCTNNDQPVPDGKDRTFHWNASARRFDEEASAVSKSLGR